MVFNGEAAGQLIEFGNSSSGYACRLFETELAGLLRLLTSSFARFTMSTRGERGEETLGSGFGEGKGLPVGLLPNWISKMLPLIGVFEARG